jgi:hypothetical protein
MINPLVLACGGTPEVDLSEDLVAHYLLNNNADDVLGLNNGTAVGGIDFQGDKAIFDGDTGWIEIPPINSIRTVCGYISGNDFGVTGYGYQALFTQWRGSDTERFGIYINASDIDKRMLVSANGITYFSHILEEDTLYHVIFTDDGVNSFLYVDNILVLTMPTGIIFSAPYRSFLGTYLYKGNIGNKLKGALSNVRMYSTYKNQQERTSLYNEGYHPRGVLSQSSETDNTPLRGLIEPPINGLVAHYPLTGTSEDTTGNYTGIEDGVVYIDDPEKGSVASFDGDTQTISFPSSGNLESIGFWVYAEVKYESLNLVDTTIIGTLSTSNSYNWVLLGTGTGASPYNSSTLSILVIDYVNMFIQNTINVGWHKLDIQWETDKYQIYLDGVHVETLGEKSVKFPLSILLGKRIYAGSWGSSKHSMYSIYNRERTMQEIQDSFLYEKNIRNIAIDEGLVAYYPLVNNSLDNSFNQLDGVDTDVSYDGNNASFNGVGSFINTGINEELKSQDVSISAVIKSSQSDNGTIVGYANYNFYYGWIVYKSSGSLRVRAYSNSGASLYSFSSESMVGDNISTHITVVIKDANYVQLYLNGELDTEWSIPTVLQFDKTMYTLVGENSVRNGYNNYFKGNISDLRLYNKALMKEQVQVIYNTGK